MERCQAYLLPSLIGIPPMTELVTASPFAALGTNIRFGAAEDGTPFAVAADFARVMDYRDARDATRILDEDEKGTQLVRTPGGPQQMTVIYEDGIWELIFRSTKPEAKALKRRVKEILGEVRRTGRYVPEPRAELTDQEKLVALAQGVLDEKRRADTAETRVAELEPAAHSWNTLADATGDFMVGDAAKILTRDPNITIGQNRLFTLLRELGWIYRGGDARWRTKQAAVEARRLCEIPKTHFDRGTGEIVVDPPQIRVTVKGIAYLHRHLGGVRPPAIPADQLTITGGGA